MQLTFLMYTGVDGGKFAPRYSSRLYTFTPPPPNDPMDPNDQATEQMKSRLRSTLVEILLSASDTKACEKSVENQLDTLAHELNVKDPDYAKNIPNNKRALLHAMEYLGLTFDKVPHLYIMHFFVTPSMYIIYANLT
jgi:hypothetical protein